MWQQAPNDDTANLHNDNNKSNNTEYNADTNTTTSEDDIDEEK